MGIKRKLVSTVLVLVVLIMTMATTVFASGTRDIGGSTKTGTNTIFNVKNAKNALVNVIPNLNINQFIRSGELQIEITVVDTNGKIVGKRYSQPWSTDNIGTMTRLPNPWLGNGIYYVHVKINDTGSTSNPTAGYRFTVDGNAQIN